MNSFILAFLLGDLYLQTFATLPSLYVVILPLLSAVMLLYFFNKKITLAFLPLAFVLGFAWTLWCAHSIASWSLNKEWEGKPLIASGMISSLPRQARFGTQFEFHLQSLTCENVTQSINTNIRLTWPNQKYIQPPALYAGDAWQLVVKLKRVHGVQSPGAYDYEAWAFQKRLRATGVVQMGNQNKLISVANYQYELMRLRQILQNKILVYAPHSLTSPWLLALILGERNGIATEDWQVLRNTGTNHLMAIGGLHIGILVAIVYFITNWLWRRSEKLLLMLPAHFASVGAAFLLAIIYGFLSGFSLPAQRAMLMLAVYFFTVVMNKKINLWNAWSLAMFFVLLMHPLAVLETSFWLSFVTIALIIYGMSYRLSPTGFWWKHGRVQWVIALGLIPLSLALFQESTLISFIANTIAIPWLAFAILPFCFLSVIFLVCSPMLASIFLWFADKSLAGLWLILAKLSHIHIASWSLAMPNMLFFILMMLGVLLLLLPGGVQGKGLGAVWILPVLLYQPDQPLTGEYWVSVLDVGQGLSVVVQTKSHTLVYDAGPKYEAATDMGQSVVLPYLRKLMTKKIDLLVLSHGDNDHIGGVDALLNAFPDTKISSSVPRKNSNWHATYCRAGQSWLWDNVNFTFLYPRNHQKNYRNDSSCVLLINNGNYKVLLPGDIEKQAERNLLMYSPEKLQANLLVAPHHGSKTSGIEEFISAVNPQVVLYATGYRNRYHFPHASVMNAYEKRHAKAYNTVDTGTIQFKVARDGSVALPEKYRVTHAKYWFDY